MRRRAAKQTLQHETRHWQERLACWIKDKDKAETGNSLAAWVNLGWFHSREIPGVRIQQTSLQPGNPPQLGPAPPLHSQCCKPIAEQHDGQHTPPKSTPRMPSKEPARRLCDLFCSVPDLQGKTEGHMRDLLKMNLWGIAVPRLAAAPGQQCPKAYMEEVFAPSCLHDTISAILLCSKPIYHARSRVGFCRAASVYPTKGVKLREASEL